jgi:hypothetical protein
MRTKRSWLDMLFLTSVLVVSAVGSGVFHLPKPAPQAAQAPVAQLAPSKPGHSHGQQLQVGRAPQALGVFLAPVNAPSSLAVSQVGEYLVKPKP